MSEATSITANRTLRRLPNAAYRPREYLTEAEVERLIEAARKRGRNGARDACAILLAYRHGLRAAELCQLRWSQIDLKHGRLHVNRAKGGIESVHPLHGPELPREIFSWFSLIIGPNVFLADQTLKSRNCSTLRQRPRRIRSAGMAQEADERRLIVAPLGRSVHWSSSRLASIG